MTSTGLLSLPVELHLRIIEMISDRESLTALHRACTTMRDVVSPTLYHNLNLIINDPRSRFLEPRLFEPVNAILVFAKNAKICGIADKKELKPRQKDIRKLIRALSDHAITVLQLGPYIPISIHNFLKVLEAQSRIRILIIDRIEQLGYDCPAWATIIVPPLPELQQLTIAYSWNNDAHLWDSLPRLIIGAKALGSLSISSKNSSTQPGVRLLEEAIAMIPVDCPKRKPLSETLTRLNLTNICLSEAAGLSSLIRKSECLEELFLKKCLDTIELLDSAAENCNTGARLHLQRFHCIIDFMDESDFPIIGRFIAACDSLRKIYIRDNCDGRPSDARIDITCILQHARTLEVLMIDAGRDYDVSDMQALVSSCTAIREIGLAQPQVMMPWDGTVSHIVTQDELEWYLGVLSKLPCLDVLCVCLPPYIEEDEESDSGEEEGDSKMVRLQRVTFVAEIFDSLPVKCLLIGGEPDSDHDIDYYPTAYR